MSIQARRWLPVLLMSLFTYWQIKAADYWGAAFGGLGLAYALVAPHETLGSGLWRLHAVRLLGLAFVLLAVAAIWKTLR